MMKMLKSKKGMSLVEVVISITILGVVAVPLMMVFTSSILLANKNRDKVDLNYIADIVVEEVRSSVKGNILLPEYGSFNPSLNDYTDYSISLRDLVIQSIDDGTEKTSDEIGIVGPNSDIEDIEWFRTFSYKVEYYDATCYDPNYNETYEFIIYIFSEGRNVKKLKIPIWVEGGIN